MNYYIITGASRGLGEALARQLLQAGNHLFCISRSANQELLDLATGRSVPLDYFESDLTRSVDAANLIKEIFRRIELAKDNVASINLVNNAGILAPIKPIAEADASEIAACVATNLIAPLVLIAQFLNHTQKLKAVKRIVNISSKAAKIPRLNWICYQSCKAGVDNVTAAVALEQKKQTYPARIISFYPGLMDTEMRKENQKAKNIFRRAFDFVVGLILPHRKGKIYSADEVASGLLKHMESKDFGNKPYIDFEEL